jgi:hypothetical protein
MVATTVELKNILIQYTGGGYDGCIFEYNYMMFNELGEWVDIAHSGRSGIKDKDTALQRIESDDDMIFIHLDNDEEIDSWQRTNACPHVVGVVHKVNEILKESVLWFKCSTCGEKVYDGGKLADFHGCGGIAITADTMLCEKCYSSHTCVYCGEYEEDLDQETHLCDWHINIALTKILAAYGDLIYLSYDSHTNQFTREEFNKDCYDSLPKGEKWFLVSSDEVVDIFHKYVDYIVSAIDEKQAMDIVSQVSKSFGMEVKDFNPYEEIDDVTLYLHNN